MELVVRRVPIDQIHLDPANTNTHDSRNMAAIVASLKEFGQVEPLIVQKITGKVIGGNGRLEAMKSLGWTECDVVEIDANSTRSVAIGIALNRTAKLSEFDDDALMKTLLAIRDDGLPIESTGFTDDELAALIAETTPGPPGEGDEQGSDDEEAEGFAVVVECRDEEQQGSLLKRFRAEGLTCKAASSTATVSSR